MGKDSVSAFSKRDTSVCKGAALILLLTHHLYGGTLPAPMPLLGGDLPRVAATLSKVCVSIFMLLSGYGLCRSFERRGGESAPRFTLRHLMGLMRPYWLIYVLFTLLSIFFGRPGFTPAEVYGTGIRGACQAVIDFLGLWPLFGTYSMCQTWWYMEAAIVMYALFPAIYWAVKKAPYAALPLFALPVVGYFIWGNNVWDTCREIYWFFAFGTGVFLAQRGVLDKLSRRTGAGFICASGAAVLVCTFIRAKIGLAFDTFYAVAIVVFLRATLCRIPYLSGAFNYIGRRSGDVFLIHSFIYFYLTSQRLFVRLLYGSVPTAAAALPVLLALSLLCAEGVGLIRRFLTAKQPE